MRRYRYVFYKFSGEVIGEGEGFDCGEAFKKVFNKTYTLKESLTIGYMILQSQKKDSNIVTYQ